MFGFRWPLNGIRFWGEVKLIWEDNLRYLWALLQLCIYTSFVFFAFAILISQSISVYQFRSLMYYCRLWVCSGTVPP
jgi:hypothetical protein